MGNIQCSNLKSCELIFGQIDEIDESTKIQEEEQDNLNYQDKKIENSILEFDMILLKDYHEQNEIESDKKKDMIISLLGSTKDIVKKIPNLVLLNIALNLIKTAAITGNFDWKIPLTCSIANSAILIIRNRMIIINLSKFTLFTGLPFIIDKTSNFKRYLFR
jgi:hypothetical protein